VTPQAPVIIVFARMSSSRLPGKSLANLGDDVVLGYVVRSLRQVNRASGVTVATSEDASDDPIAEWCHQIGVDCFRGSLDDVAGRALAAAEMLDAAAFVRISGDSPLIDPALVDYAISLFHDMDCDLATNVFPRSFPRGQSVEVLRRSALDAAYKAGFSSSDKEHVTKAFYARPELYSIVNFTADDLGPSHSGAASDEGDLVVDELSDLERCREIVSALHPRHPWQVGWRRCASIGAELRGRSD
jgi:spore coat polysaccharide biosynthesis protein SpsF